jgi:hypothetical protein
VETAWPDTLQLEEQFGMNELRPSFTRMIFSRQQMSRWRLLAI